MTANLVTNVPAPAHPDVPGSVVAVVVEARRVPSVEREAYAARLADLPLSEAMVVLHTCHRVEVYLAGDALGDLRLPELPANAVRLEGVLAARHLISTACGLESAVLGEDQILHQVRRTLIERRAAGPLDRTLDRLFQVALQAGREAHSWFAGDHRSLGDVALDEIEQRRGPLGGQRVLVVGAGSMGRVTALAAVRRGAEVVLTNRSAERAEGLAAAVGGSVLPWGEDLPDVAGVVVALAGPWSVSAADRRRLAEGATVVDLSSPPATPEELQLALATSFVSVDDLAWGIETAALPDWLHDRLEDLVSDAGGQFCRWLRARENHPTIKAMTDAADRRRRAEVDWLLRRMPNLSQDEVELVERMSDRLVGGILHGPLSVLRLDETGDLGRAARELFGV